MNEENIIGYLITVMYLSMLPFMGLYIVQSKWRHLGALYMAALIFFYSLIKYGFITAIGVVILFLLIPLIIAPIAHYSQVILLRKTEKKYGNSGIKLKFECLSVYKGI